MLTNINLLTTNYMTSLIPCLKFTVNLYCDAVFSRIHLVIVDASTRSISKLSLCVTHSTYIRRWVWEMILRLTCFQGFYPLAYNKYQYVQTEISLILMLTKNKPMFHLYFHQIESVGYFTFLVLKYSIFLDVTGNVYLYQLKCFILI